MVICQERGADLHMAQLMPLPLTVSRFSKIQISFTSLVPAHLGSPGTRAVKRVCVCVCVADSIFGIQPESNFAFQLRYMAGTVVGQHDTHFTRLHS